MNVCVIPARGGSKRIPRKNIRPFSGRPIIAYSIDAARGAAVFDDVVVSTDDAEIADVARSCEASVPFFRSPRTADDHAGLADVLIEVAENLAERGRPPELVACVLPTAVFVQPHELVTAMEVLRTRSDVDAVASVVRYDHPIERALEVTSEGHLRMRWPENRTVRSQDLPVSYHDAGQFYVIRRTVLIDTGSLFPRSTHPIVLPAHRVQDIDTEEDWDLAETKYRLLEAHRS